MAVRVVVAEGGDERSTEVAPGESWAAAARRVAGPHDPVALDLSGEVKRFVLDPEPRVTLRPMTRGDLPAVLRWRSAPHVRRWWADTETPTIDTVTRHYGPRIDGTEPTRMWVTEVHGRSAGFVQDYRLRDHPGFAVLTPDPEAVGVDYVVGEPALVDRGVGTAMLWAWVRRAREHYPDVASYFAAPDHRNRASLRVLDKVGFVRGTWFDEPQRDGSVTTMVGCTMSVCRVLG